MSAECDALAPTAHCALPTTLERAVFTPAFRVQLTPSDEPCTHDFLAQAALYGALFLRMRNACIEPDALDALLAHREPEVQVVALALCDVLCWVSIASRVHLPHLPVVIWFVPPPIYVSHANQVKGALYCAIPDVLFRGAYARVLKARGYSFWNHEESTGEVIYYRWCNLTCPSRVPRYATSIEGGGLIVLSPCETRILCVYELGRWCFPGGAVEYDETSLEAAVRESREECGVELDDAFPLRLAGGWNIAAARDRRINDHFLIYVGRARSEVLHLDENEITQARWVPLESLHPLLATLHDDDTSFMTTNPAENTSYSTALLFALRRYLDGHSQPAKVHTVNVSDTQVRRITFLR